MSKQSKRTRKIICNLCYACEHDCVEVEPRESCEHFKQGFTRKQYLTWLREDNTHIRKLCDKKGLSYNTMMRMLNGSLHFKRSYRMALNDILFEKEEYLPYIEKWNSGNFDNCESSEGDVACGKVE